MDTPLAAALARSLIGEDLSAFPFISAFGAIARLSRLNVVRRRGFRELFGITVPAAMPLHRLLSFSAVRRARLAERIHVSPELTQSWSPAWWTPFAGAEVWKHANWPLRVCPACARWGYHCEWFQMPWVTHCPWHRIALIDRCLCGKRLGYLTTADALAWKCSCGRDLYRFARITHASRFPTEMCRGHLQAWATWAAHERGHSHLIAPMASAEPDLDGHLARLVRPQADRVTGVARTHVWIGHDTTRCPAPSASLTPYEKPFRTLLPVARRLIGAMDRVTVDVVGKLFPADLTAAEWQAFRLDPSVLPTPTARRASETEVLFLPARHAPDGGGWVDTSAVSAPALSAVESLVHWSRSAGSHIQLDLVWRAVWQLLLRGYAEGVRRTLGRLVPDLFLRLPTLLPRHALPALLIRTPVGERPSITIVWTVHGARFEEAAGRIRQLQQATDELSLNGEKKEHAEQAMATSSTRGHRRKFSAVRGGSSN